MLMILTFDMGCFPDFTTICLNVFGTLQEMLFWMVSTSPNKKHPGLSVMWRYALKWGPAENSISKVG